MCIPADAMRLEILLSLVIPTTVASIRGSRSENWSAAVARSIPDLVEATLPALVSVTAGVVEPRYPSFKGIMAAKSKPVDQLTLADLGIDAATVGAAGAGQETVSVDDAPAREAGEIVEDDGEGYAKIVAYLENLKVI